MNSRNRLHSVLLAALGLAASATTAGAALVADLQAPVSVSLKLTTTTPVKVRPTLGGRELSNRFSTVRFTTRDWILDLIAQGRIVGPASGWRIVARTTTDETYGLAHRLYATKPGQPDHALDSDGPGTLALDFPYAVNRFRVRIRDEQIVSETTELRFAVEGVVETPRFPLQLAGHGAERVAGRRVTLGAESGLLLVPLSIKLKLAGGAEFAPPAGDPEVYVADGHIHFGAHRITSVRVAPPAE